MPVKDDFPYTARWDSVGLDCAYCTHVKGPAVWPDLKGELFCTRHQVPLSVELDKNGYKEGEWFCSEFSDNGQSNRNALSHLNKIRSLLDPGKLYGFYGSNGNLKELPLHTLKTREND